MNEPESSLDITPEMALEAGLKDIREGRFKDNPPAKALVLFLWDDDGEYNTSFLNAGMSYSQMALLCHHVAFQCHNQILS